MMKNSVIKILIADDQIIIRERLKQLVAEAFDMCVVDEASSGQQALDLVRKDYCDVVLLDINMPGKGGIAALKELKSEKPDIPVIVLSMYPEESYAVRTLKAGASVYIAKESASKELIGAIRKVAQGNKYV